jgi:transposase
MIKVTLSEFERGRLEQTFKTTPNRRLRHRCQAILMAARGRRHHHIANDLSISPRTLQRWLQAYQTHGLDGLTIRWAPGRTPQLSAALAPEILAWIKAGPAGCGLDRANWTYAELVTHLYQTHGLAVSESTMRAFCTKHGVRPYRPTYRYLKGDPELQEAARHELEAFKKKAAAGELVLLSQDEARFSLVPTLRTTLGVKGHRPLVGNLDCHEYLYVFGALNLVSGQLTTHVVERLRPRTRAGASTHRYLQAGFAKHLRAIARAYPAQHSPRVVVVIDKAPWHRGTLLQEVLTACPHLELYPLPSYSPQLQVIERFWKVLRRRATHNRLFPTMAELKQSLRNNLCYYQTLKQRVLSLIQSSKKRTKLTAA